MPPWLQSEHLSKTEGHHHLQIKSYQMKRQKIEQRCLKRCITIKMQHNILIVVQIEWYTEPYAYTIIVARNVASIYTTRTISHNFGEIARICTRSVVSLLRFEQILLCLFLLYNIWSKLCNP